MESNAASWAIFASLIGNAIMLGLILWQGDLTHSGLAVLIRLFRTAPDDDKAEALLAIERNGWTLAPVWHDAEVRGWQIVDFHNAILATAETPELAVAEATKGATNAN